MKHDFLHLDLSLYTYKIDNGMMVYVIPDSKVNNIYATFSTKYGSKQNTFIPNGKKKMVSVPDGIAHFLEHKLFEQPDGKDPFSIFSEHGADANANTSQFKTTYLFSGVDYFKENLNFLLDYVQTPYFTDANVEKEKGIIEQEIKMYHDEPSWRLLEQVIFNMFHTDPIRIPIAGTVDSIKSITKEDLYLCYNTFYHPANMFVVVTGNVNPDEVYQIVKENQAKKEYDSKFSLKVKNYDEEKTVAKEKETIKMNVNIPKVGIGFKLDIKKLQKYNRRDIINYLNLFFDIKSSQTSSLVQSLKEDDIITDSIDTYLVDADDYIVFYFEASTKKPTEFIERLKQEIWNGNVSEEDFNRKKKVYLSNYVTATDNIFMMNSLVMNNIISYGNVDTKIYDCIKSYSYEELKEVITNITFENTSEVIIMPKNSNN
ncbi:MAG: pitrilysin family protein [Bacilli bacterium]|nr:pitrilysin family protein [Bacilli bacterium]